LNPGGEVSGDGLSCLGPLPDRQRLNVAASRAQDRTQYRVGRYRIDLVVEGERGRLAIELDGDAYHGPERWEADRQRQAILERSAGPSTASAAAPTTAPRMLPSAPSGSA
jgi:REase_MTES_1575